MEHTKEKLLWIGLTVAVAVIAGAILGGSSISQAQSESLEIKSVELKKGSSGLALLSVKIQNAGDSPLSNITGQLNFDTIPSSPETMNPFIFTFTPTDLQPGALTTFVADVTDSSDMVHGESFTLFVNGTTLQGSFIQDSGVATVSRF